METLDAAAANAASQVWDAVVIGAGAGGATVGLAIARAGRSVLFLERGKPLDTDATVVKGRPFAWRGGQDAALRHGWWPEPVFQRDGASERPNQLPIGCGTGGSTAVFGMIMDRLRPVDFMPRANFPDASESTLPEAWPITYADLEPFYEEAEQLFRVRGTPDPLHPTRAPLLDPPPPSAKEQAVSDALAGCGLHPYRIHYARDRVPDCSGCPAMLCARDCRNDAGRICLRPAIDHHGAHLLTDCRVVRLEAENRAVRRAVCEWRGQPLTIRGQIFVVAANAFFTPALLMQSASERFPDGLANSSGLVGRNLMLHASDFLLLRLKRGGLGLAADMIHGLSLNDFYVRDGVKLGNVHAHAAPIAQRRHWRSFRCTCAGATACPLPFVPRSRQSGLASTGPRPCLRRSWKISRTPPTASFCVPARTTRSLSSIGTRVNCGRGRWALFQGFSRAVRHRFSVQPLGPIGR